MKSLPNKYFGPDGLPCVFDADGNGTPAVGWLKKQISNYFFVVSDGIVSRKVRLCQTEDEVANIQSSLPVNSFTILIAPPDNIGDPEHIKSITYDRCATVQGSGFFWHNNTPDSEFAGIVIPSLGVGDYRLLETGEAWLREDGGFWLIQTAPQTGPYILTEDDGFLLLEDGNKLELV